MLLFEKIKIPSIFKKSIQLNKDEMASLLKTSPEALFLFEKQYSKICLPVESRSFFQKNAKQASTHVNKEISELMLIRLII